MSKNMADWYSDGIMKRAAGIQPLDDYLAKYGSWWAWWNTLESYHGLASQDIINECAFTAIEILQEDK